MLLPLLVATASAQVLAVATPSGSEKAIAVLLEQANYWRLQNRPDQVVRALERVLAVDPRNPEALASAAQAQAQLGNRAAADALIARLRAASPADQRLQETDVTVRAATIDQNALLEARRLAQSGRGAEAVAQYRELFRSPTPPDSTRRNSTPPWRGPRAAMTKRARASPGWSSARRAMPGCSSPMPRC
ncbi:tetratricopeptide repeat protein [Dankookia sp. P2]|uniref:tetratricopeptide repeat protein n=1 Tax=Dankookia sp. P2 TaxID=3423955 RepID=UPI003D66FEE7